jgi:hypothetical protein
MTEQTTACTCGQIHMEYYPEENQYEPACWECYYTHMECIDTTVPELLPPPPIKEE